MAHGGVCGHTLTPPHDITGKPIRDFLPQGPQAELYLRMMKRSADILKDHPVNAARRAAGKNPANSAWFWGEGTKPALENFREKFGKRGGVISAVDLVKGIGILAGMKVIEVEGATGNYDTNFAGKADAALHALLQDGLDFIYIHMEAPDECGHQGDIAHKVYSIEQIDSRVVARLTEGLRKAGEDFRMLICPDHPTPIAVRTHVADPIPYLLFDSRKQVSGPSSYDEESAKQTGIFIEKGWELMKRLLDE